MLAPVAVDPLDDERPAVLIEVRGGFVEEQDLGGVQQQPQEREPGALPGGEARRISVSNFRIEPQRPALLGEPVPVLREVSGDDGTPETRLGGKEADPAAPLRRRQRPARPAAPSHAPLVRIEVRERPQQARLSRTGRAGNGHHLSPRHLEGERGKARNLQTANGEHVPIVA